MSAAATPAAAIASSQAGTARSTAVCSVVPQRRVTIPLRSRIHSSEESIQVQTSSLVTTRSGR